MINVRHECGHSLRKSQVPTECCPSVRNSIAAKMHLLAEKHSFGLLRQRSHGLVLWKKGIPGRMLILTSRRLRIGLGTGEIMRPFGGVMDSLLEFGR